MERYCFITIYFVLQFFLLYADNTSFNSSSVQTGKKEELSQIFNGDLKDFTFITVPNLTGLDLSYFFGPNPGAPPPIYPWNPWFQNPQQPQFPQYPQQPVKPTTDRPPTTIPQTTTDYPYYPVQSTASTGSGGFTASHSNIGYEIPCGIRKYYKKSLKIVGGNEAEPGEFPWQISLQIMTDTAPRHICGGAILTSSWVVTAGHCVHRINSNKLSVVSGDYQLYTVEGSEQRSSVVRIVKNNYNFESFSNDIALLLVSPAIKLDGFTTAPICLPDSSVKFTAGFAMVTGWGRLSENGALAHKLQKVTLPIMDKHRCNQLYQAAGYNSYLNRCQLCCGYEGGGKDSCQGDSGGPLICHIDDNRYYLCGIVSWGVGCARPGFPGVYTLTPCYSDWIRNVIYNWATEKKDTQESETEGVT